MRAPGIPHDPPNRFERLRYEGIPEERLAGCLDPDNASAARNGDDGRRVELLRDPSRTIVATNTSPDISFDASVNPYRGCEHACVYCYARPTHEYLGFSAGRDFETRILVKERAPSCCARRSPPPVWPRPGARPLGRHRRYQPAERKLGVTRALPRGAAPTSATR